MNKIYAFLWPRFSPRSWDGTLTGKNLLPYREQIFSSESAITNQWNDETVNLFHSIAAYSALYFKLWPLYGNSTPDVGTFV